MNIRRNVRILVHKLEISARPGGAKPHNFWWRSVVITLLGRERRVFAIEGAWQVRTIDAEAFLRRIDAHLGIHSQEAAHSAHVISLAVGNTHELQLGRGASASWGVLATTV